MIRRKKKRTRQGGRDSHKFKVNLSLAKVERHRLSLLCRERSEKAKTDFGASIEAAVAHFQTIPAKNLDEFSTRKLKRDFD